MSIYCELLMASRIVVISFSLRITRKGYLEDLIIFFVSGSQGLAIIILTATLLEFRDKKKCARNKLM